MGRGDAGSLFGGRRKSAVAVDRTGALLTCNASACFDNHAQPFKEPNMTPIEVMAGSLAQSHKMLKDHIADFSDADMLTRPTPAANHTAWQLGHLILAEAGMVNACAPGAVPPPPAGFSDKFTKETAKNDDPKAFVGKSELLAVFDRNRTATIAWAKTLTPADFEKPGPEKMREFIPTVGHLVALLPVHDAMHLGQIQVIRRKLGRPLIF
jgi:uncharacterized damage-inducible protein DinB